MTADLDVAFFVALRETSPLQLRLSWDEFVERLSKHREQSIKDGPGFSAALYRAGTTRGNDGVESLSAAVVDIDHDEPMWNLLEGLEYVAFTSYSHASDETKCGRADCQHWRIVLPFSQSVPRDQWTDVRARVKFWLVPNADDGAKDAARFNYMPACKTGAPRETRHGLGEFLNPGLLAPVPVQAPSAPGERTNGHVRPVETEERPGDRLTRVADWGDILGPHGWRSAGERGETTYWIRPNKHNGGHSATSGGGGYNVLYVFSSNAAPFDPFTSYTKFKAYSLLNHNGDDTEATKELAKKFGMTSPKTIGWKKRPAAADGEAQADDEEHEEPRPQIDAGEGDLPTIMPEVWDALSSANIPPLIFQRMGTMVRLEQEPNETPVLREMTPDRLRHELAGAAIFYVMKKGKDKDGKEEWFPKQVPPPMHFVKDALATPNMPVAHLNRIVEAPVFGADGACNTEPGYHPSSRSYYAPPDGLVVPPVPEVPSAEDIEQAKLILLTELLGDFPFVDQADRAHALALSLLPYARDLIPGPTPAHNMEAPTPGSGKTLLAHALLSPSCGSALRSLSQARDDDEWRKRLTTALRDGTPAILIDNINQALDSGSLSSALTSTTWNDRLLGQNEMISVPVRCAWAFTGNNPVLSTEMARRSIRIRIDPGMDRPFLREGFRHPDLNAWIVDHRGELIWANLVLIRHWIQIGRPSFLGRMLGSYEHWTRVIGGVLEQAGIEGFLGNLAEFYEAADSDGMVWRVFVESWWEKYRSAEVGASELFIIGMETEGMELGNGNERSQRSVFGRSLVRQRDRVIGEYRIVQGKTRHNSKTWRLLSVSSGGLGGLGGLKGTSQTPSVTRKTETDFFSSEPGVEKSPEVPEVPLVPRTCLDCGSELLTPTMRCDACQARWRNDGIEEIPID